MIRRGLLVACAAALLLLAALALMDRPRADPYSPYDPADAIRYEDTP